MKNRSIPRDILLFLIVVIVSLHLSSCFGMQTQITLNENGTGTINLVYRVSQMLLRFGSVSETSADLPLPVERNDFQRMMNQIEGITLSNYSQQDTEDDRIITAQLEFSSPNALASLLGLEEKSDIQLDIDGENGRFRYTIFKVTAENTESTETDENPVDPESLALIQSLFSGYELSYTLEVPGEIESSLPGQIEENGNSATFSIEISDAMASENDLVWEVVW